MVKNLPSVERSTKIRFGKHVPDSNDQEENTIVFNASNVAVPTPYSNAVYLSPIRNRTDYTAPSVVLLMYDRDTKEITESGETANALIGGSTLDVVVNRSNATSNVVQFSGTPDSLVTSGNIGIANLLPLHTVSVGSNLYIDDEGSNVLVVSGNVSILKDMIVEGNLTVNGDTTVIYTENTSIKDAFIELGRDNTSGDTTLDLGVLMHRPDALSNVVVGYREGSDEFTIAYTDAKPTDKTFTPKTDEDINVHVYGLTHIDANIYAHEDVLVSGNAYVTGNISVTDQLTITGNVYADKDLELAGNAYVSGNVNVTKQLSVTGNAYVSGNVEVTKALIVSGNTHLEGDNVFITNTMNFLNSKTSIVTDQVSNVQIRLGQLENVANTASNPLINQVLAYDNENNEWANCYPDQTILQVKNTSGGPITRGQALHVKGSNGNNIFEVDLADASDPTKMPAIGIAYEDMADNAQGAAVSFGRANGIGGMSGYTNGQTLYVASGTPGGLTNVKPYGVDLDQIQNVGVVVNKNAGVIFVTGIGRANDIPNARIITDYNEMNYVYVNDTNNDLKKITSANLNIPLTTAVSSSSNSAANAVTLRGVSITSGDGFHGDLTVAGNVTVDTNTLKVDAEANRVGILTTSPGQTLDVRGAANVGALTTTSASVTDTTHSTSKDTGVLIVTNGGLGVEANIHSTNVFAASHIAVGTSATTKALDVRGTSNVGVFTTPDATVTDSTAATSKTTGALKVTGGVGIQGDIHATHANLEDVEADSVNITDTTAATDTTTGALKVAGGTGIQGDLYANDGHFTSDLSVGNLTDLNNKYLPMVGTDGVFVKSPVYVTPGGKYVISASQAEFLGNITLGGNTTIISSTSITISDRIFGVGANNSASGLDSGFIIEHQDDGTFANVALIHHADEHRFSIGYTQNTFTQNHIIPYQHEDGTLLRIDLLGNVLVQNNLTVNQNSRFSGKVGIKTGTPGFDLDVRGTSNVGALSADSITISDSTAATNKTSGALQVAGGVGVQGALYGAAATFDGVTSVTNGTVATNKTTGALVVTGGTGISGALYGAAATFDGVTSVTNGTAATDKTTGALTVTTGGLGVEANIHSTNVFAVSHIGLGVTDGATVYALDIRGTSNVGVFTTPDASVTDSAVAYSTTTGALKVTGGISTQDNVYVGNDTYISSNLNVNTNTLHVDSQANRVGIGKTDPAVALDVVGAGSFSGAVSGTTGTFTGDVSGVAGSFSGAVSGTTGTFTGDVSGVAGSFSGAVSGTTGTFTGDVSGVAGSFSGAVSGTTGTFTGDVSGVAGSFSGAVSGTTGTFTGDVSGVAGSFSGAVSGTTGTFTGVTSVTNDTDATSTTDGALIVSGGAGIAKTLYAADISSGSVDITDTTAATSTTTGALKVAGGISTQTNIHASNVYITGGLITNTGQVTKKTYSYSGDLPNLQTIANSTITITFSNHVFYAKIVAHLVESDDEVSTLAFECGGGNWSGTAPANNIAPGPVSVFGGTSTNPWNSSITTTGTTVAFAPTTNMAADGHYNVFIEYISQSSSGVVTKITEGVTDQITFNY